MILVQSTFKLVPETRDEALDLMKTMVKHSRKELGCVSYEYFEGISDPNKIVLFQEWENAECLQGHYETDHMAEFLSRLGDYLSSPVATRSFVAPESDYEIGQEEEDSERDSPSPTLH